MASVDLKNCKKEVEHFHLPSVLAKEDNDTESRMIKMATVESEISEKEKEEHKEYKSQAQAQAPEDDPEYCKMTEAIQQLYEEVSRRKGPRLQPPLSRRQRKRESLRSKNTPKENASN